MRKKFERTGIWLGIIFLGAAIFSTACSKGIKGEIDPSQFDWSNGFLKAKGYGRVDPNIGVFERRFNALQEAKQEAVLQLRQLVYALPVDSENRVEDLVKSEKDMREKIERFIRSAKVVSTRLEEDREFEVEMELYLGVSLKSALGLLDKSPTRKDQQSNSDSSRF